MNGNERRQSILALLRQAKTPLSGTAIGKQTGVSRQVIVQDIALLRTEGYAITATSQGYLLSEPHVVTRVLKLRHTNEETEDELCTVVDLGGAVVDVMVNHRIYGKLTAPLGIKSRRDVQAFLEGIRSGKSAPLMNITSGYHFHQIAAESEEILDEIEAALRARGYLAALLPYEG